MHKMYLLLMSTLCTVVLFAQEGDDAAPDTASRAENSAWYTAPSVWVLSAALIIIVLVALTRGGSRRTE